MSVADYVKDYFGAANVSQVGSNTNVLRCIHRSSSQVPYQFIYVDQTDNWCKPDFATYIESNILKDYYDRAGYLQWNFYYYFLSDDNLLREQFQQRLIVEREDSYCRKAVIKKEDFFSLFDALREVRVSLGEEETKDLYSIWVKELREKKMFFVFDDIKYPNYKQPTEDYLNGLPFDDIEIGHETEDHEQISISQLVSLSLNRYRKYPQGIQFPLGRVTLVHGANAAGKTSFLEAIELAITGKSKSLNTPDYLIELKDKDNKIIEYPESSAVYKQRDISWYKTGMTRGNNLSSNFQRFNFYTSDAAFELKQSHNSREYNLEKVIEDIALGSEVNKLETRIKEFTTRFGDRLEDFNALMDKANKEIADKNRNIESLQTDTQDISFYKTALQEVLKDNNWKSDLSVIEDQDLLARLESRLRYCLSCAKEIDVISANLSSVLTVEQTRQQVQESTDRLETLTKKRDEERATRDQIQAIENKVDSISKAVKITSDLKPYFSVPNIDELLGLDAKINDLQSQLDQSREMEKAFNGLVPPDQKFTETNRDVEVDQLNSDAIKLSQAATENLEALEKKIKEVETGVKEVQRIYNEIKSLGSQYIHVGGDSKECPMCNTSFETGKLAEAVLKLKDSFSASEQLLRLKVDKERATDARDKAIKTLQYTNSVRALAKSYETSQNVKLKTLADLLTFFELNRGQLTTINDKLLSLNTTKSIFYSQGLSGAEFERLKTAYKGQEGKAVFTKEDYQQAEEFISSSKIENEEKLLTLRKSLSSLQITIKEVLQSQGDLTNVNSNLRTLTSKLDEIENYFLLEPDDKVNTLSARMESCLSSFEAFKKIFQENQSKSKGVQILQEQITTTLREVEDLKLKRNHSQFAFDTLSHLLNTFGKSIILNDYLQNNKTEIVKVFSYIHSPSEFTDIHIQQNEISLVSRDGERRTLNEISTGQRSALALSIFLSLNLRLTEGPSLLMFDDPVTYVDDLNILSFIDYLREIVLKTNRQIIFATANEDVAFLFAKKFEFLGEEFKRIKFERAN